MNNTRIIISKSKKKIYVYKGTRVIYTAKAFHGGKKTWKGKRKILKWSWGAISSAYEPLTWFSFGATFKGWPLPGKEGFITKWGTKWKVKRITNDRGEIIYNGNPYPIWKDINPFGIVMADLHPGKVELHGTGKDINGNDVFPNVTHGCVRTYNKDILRIKNFAPPGTEVHITD
jgi:hypothetical protein